jgi:hypothetical protein
VSLVYLESPTNGALKQGEIISEVYEFQPIHPTRQPSGESGTPVQPIHHPHLVVMNPECDLLWDYQARVNDREQAKGFAAARDHPSLLPHVLMCELYQQDEIRDRSTIGSDIWKRIRQNQDERFHHLYAAPVGDSQATELPDLYLDFKKILTLPTHLLYEALKSPKIRRLAVVPPVYVQDVMHRFYGFLGRVGVP